MILNIIMFPSFSWLHRRTIMIMLTEPEFVVRMGVILSIR